MEQFKPLLLKTYGKERRKLCAWISPDNRKRAFDSSGSKNGSVFESPKRKKTSKRRVDGRRQRAAKEKARQCLAEKSSIDDDTSDEENMIPSPPPPPPPQHVQQKKRSKSQANMQLKKTFAGNRKTRFVSVAEGLSLEGQQISSSSDKEASVSKPPKNPAKTKTGFTGQSSFVGRFVTCRRRAHTRPNLPKGLDSLLNSSEDFTSGASRATRIHRPSRKRKKPPVFESSSEENSLNAAGISGFVFNPLQEITLNELPGRGLGHCPQRPVFCSTPSASFFSKHAPRKPFPISDLSTMSSSVSVISIKDLCSSQENLAFPSDPVTKQQKEPDLYNKEEPSAVPSAIGLSTDSAGPSEFVSATGELEWLIETLKEKCLTKRCTVQLERLDDNARSELCSKSTYSSCLEHSSSCQSTNEKPQYRSQTVDPSLQESQNQQVPVTNGSSQAGNRLKEAASTIGGRAAIISPIVDNEHLAKHSSTQVSVELLESVFDSRSTPEHEDSNFDIIIDTPSPPRKAKSAHLTPEEATSVKNESLGRKCSVRIQKLALKQLSVYQGTKHQEMEYRHNSKEMRSSGEMTESRNVPVKKSKYQSSTVVTQSTESESVKNAAVLPTQLKEKCLTKKLTVNMKRVTKSQLKEMLQFKDATMRSPAVSSSAHDEPATDDPPSGNDSDNGIEDSPSLKGDMKNQGSASFQHTATEKEMHTCEVAPNRKKMHRAPKDRKMSTATNGPGTTRKACVSGLSVSRWKNKGSANKDPVGRKTALMGSARSADCSITDFISKPQQCPQKLLGSSINFSTPLRASHLNLSSLMADLTPTWSRLKAALSVHRKVLLTPKCLAVDSPERTGLADVSQDLFAMPLRTPFSRHLHSQLQSCHSPSLGEEDLSDAEKVYAECGQQHPLAWEECILPQYMKKCVKIGEGTFGEVFTTTSPSGDTIALKVIPVEGAEKVNGEDQKTFGEILHEIIISKELSSLKEKQINQTHGFIGLKGLHCVKGCYPPDFLKAWDAFDKRKRSENDRPDFFEEDQLFLILEFEFGGVDLENSNGTLASLVVAKSILHQVTAALAVAEQELQFEHRDLHWGNVLVKTTKEKKGSFLLNGTAQCVETKGVLVRIIDYSLSRLEIDNLTVSCDISNDEALFLGQGDYQFDIYRLMRQENGNNWSNYHPHTNVLWLHYLCSKLLSMKYRSSRGRDAKDVRKELTRFYDNVLQYGSATEVLQNYPMFQ